MTLDSALSFLRATVHVVVDYWPHITAVLLLVLRARTPAAWVALGEKHPRTQGLIRALRGAGLDPVKVVTGLVQVVTARAPLPAPAGVSVRTHAQRAYEAHCDALGWRDYAGVELLPWSALPERTRAAWVAALAGVLTPTGELPAGAPPAASTASGDAPSVDADGDAADGDAVDGESIAPPPPTEGKRAGTDGQRGGASVEVVAFVCILAAASLPLGVVLMGCPKVTRDPVVAPPPAGCMAGATVCYAGTPWRCGPGGRWAQADRRCDLIGGVCCLTRSALTPALLHACTSTNRCERDPEASVVIVEPDASLPSSTP